MRNVSYITNGFAAPVNYHVPGPLGTQFASPFGDPYRVQSTGGFWSSIGSGLSNLASGIGKVITPALPGLAQVGVGSLLSKPPQTTSQQPSQSQFTQVTGQAQAEQVEKSNTAIYVAVGVVALAAAYYFISKRRR
jgi:hypothetical protein